MDAKFKAEAKSRITETVPRAFENQEAIIELERFFDEACAEKGIEVPKTKGKK
jgi:hypothetical protein